MQYMLLLHSEEAGWANMTDAQQQQGMAAYMAYGDALKSAGVLMGDNRLRSTSTSTTVKIRDGKTKLVNGPYSESKEQLGGYYHIDVKDLDEALKWAEKCPGAHHGAIEVRPVWLMNS